MMKKGDAGMVSKAIQTPEMSVLLVTPDNYETIRKTLWHLRAQTISDRLEVIIIAPSREGLGLEESVVSGFHRLTIVEVGEIKRVSEAKAEGLRRATGLFIAFAEDHCYPEPEWAAHLLAAHRKGWDAVGPALCNANPHTMISWAGLLLHFGCCLDSGSAGESKYLPWHNTSYRRALLMDYGTELAAMLAVEGMLLDDLAAKGHGLYFEGSARTAHVNISRLSSWIIHAFWGGRLFASRRAGKEGWSRWRRLLYIGGGPLIPPIRLWRAVAKIYQSGRQHQLIPRIIPAMVAGLIPHAVGEVTGYLLGAGNAEQRYSYFEMKRTRHITAQDRQQLQAMRETEFNLSNEAISV